MGKHDAPGIGEMISGLKSADLASILEKLKALTATEQGKALLIEQIKAAIGSEETNGRS